MPEPTALPAPPFEETEAESSLRRIAEAVRNRDEKERAHARAKLVAKEAKEALDRADEEYRQICRAETTELPLFPRPRVDPPRGNGIPTTDPPSAPAPDPDATTWLSSLPISAAIVIALGVAGLQTVADLRWYLAAGNALQAIEGITERDGEQVRAALERYYRAPGRPQDASSGPGSIDPTS